MKYSALTVCLLRPREVAEFERHGVLPECRRGGEHTHICIRLPEAERREADGHGRFLDELRRFMAAEPNRVWSPRGSGRERMRTLQLVRGCVRGRAGQFRTTVPALGAHGRNTTVGQNNYVPPKQSA